MSPSLNATSFLGSPECMAFARSPFVKPLKRDYIPIPPLPDARNVPGTIGNWFEDDNENNPQSGLKMHAPSEFFATQTATA